MDIDIVISGAKYLLFYIISVSVITRKFLVSSAPHTFLASVGMLFARLQLVVLPFAIATENYDVVIYGSTSGAVATAIQSSRLGRSVALVSPVEHIGILIYQS